jgi:hypothetical protein
VSIGWLLGSSRTTLSVRPPRLSANAVSCCRSLQAGRQPGGRAGKQASRQAAAGACQQDTYARALTVPAHSSHAPQGGSTTHGAGHEVKRTSDIYGFGRQRLRWRPASLLSLKLLVASATAASKARARGAGRRAGLNGGHCHVRRHRHRPNERCIKPASTRGGRLWLILALGRRQRLPDSSRAAATQARYVGEEGASTLGISGDIRQALAPPCPAREQGAGWALLELVGLGFCRLSRRRRAAAGRRGASGSALPRQPPRPHK